MRARGILGGYGVVVGYLPIVLLKFQRGISLFKRADLGSSLIFLSYTSYPFCLF